MKMIASRSLDLVSPRRRLDTPAAVSLWRPDVVLATSITAAPRRRAVAVAGPAARPPALQTQLGAARSVLDSLAGVRALGAASTVAHARAEHAGSTRERVSATIAAYRAESALDDVLAGAWRRISALMEARGLR
jgi:hypothetical protein